MFDSVFASTKWKYVSTKEEFLFTIEELEKSSVLAFDTETYVLPEYKGRRGSTALDPHRSRISLFILASEKQKDCPFLFDFILLKEVLHLSDWSRFVRLLRTRKALIGFRVQFDIKFVKSQFGILLYNVRCVQLQAKLIGNATGSKIGRKRGYSLQDCVRDYFSIHMKKGKGNVDWYARPDINNPESVQEWVERLDYAAEDVKYLFDLDRLFTTILSNPLPHSALVNSSTSTEPPFGLGMGTILELEMQIAAVAGELEYNGIPASLTMMKAIELANYDPSTETGQMIKAAVKLCERFGLEYYTDRWTGEKIPTKEAIKSLNSSQKLKKLIEGKLGIGEIDTVQASFLERTLEILQALSERSSSQEVPNGNDIEERADIFVDQEEEELYRELELLEEGEALQNSEMISEILEYKRLSKQNSMCLSKFINPVTGRVHSSIDMLGAATGRSSCLRKGTLISLWNKEHRGIVQVPIENVKVGDYAICSNEKGKFVRSLVLASECTGFKELIRLSAYQSGSIFSYTLDLTPEHKVRGRRRFIPAKDLVPGTDLVLSLGTVDDRTELTDMRRSYRTIVSNEEINESDYVFNLEIEEHHNFIANGICVANSASPNQQNVSGRSKIPVAIHIDQLFNLEDRSVDSLQRDMYPDENQES